MAIYVEVLKKIRELILGVFLLVFIVVPAILLIVGAKYVYTEGYLGFHWQRLNAIYDPKLETFRCLDESGQSLMEGMEPPCRILNQRGQNAMKRYEKACEEKGGTHDACRKAAVEWIYSTR